MKSAARWWLVLTALTAALVVPSSAAAAGKPPELNGVRASVTLSAPRNGFAGELTLRVRFCAEIGPGAALLFREARSAGGSTKASRSSVERLGATLDRVRPYKCLRGFVVRWRVPTRLLVGGGTYSVSVRLRDGRGRVTPPLAFSVPR